MSAMATGISFESSKSVSGIPNQNPTRKIRPDTKSIEKMAFVL